MTIDPPGLWRRARDRAGAALSRIASLPSFILLIGALFVINEVYRAVDQRADRLEDGRRDTTNLTKALAQHAEDTIRVIDGILVGVVERLEADGTTLFERDRMRGHLLELVARLPQLNGMAVFDHQGDLIANALPGIKPFNVADREDFRYHRDKPERDVHISVPVRSRATGAWIIPVSRRINGPDGNFAGVALATVDMGYFQKFYDRFEIGRRGSILLASADGTLLARRPFVEANVGRDMRGSTIFRDYLPRASAGTMEIRSSTDGVVRLNSYQRVASYPLVVAAALATDELLAPWWSATRLQVLRAAAFLATIAALGWLLSRRNRAFARQAGLLNGTLDNMREGLMVIEANGQIPLCNRRAVALLGLPERLLTERPFADEVIETYPELAPMVLSTGYSAGHSQAAHEGERVCEHRRANGRVLEVRIVPFSSGGQILTFHDITDRKQIEDRLQASESKFRLLAENASDVIVLLRNHDDARLYVSPSIKKLLGYLPDEFIAMDRVDFIHPEDLAPMLAVRAGLGAGHRTVTSLHRLRHRDGHFVWVETAYTQLDAADGNDVTVAVIRDVTERQQRSAELAAAKQAAEVATVAKSEFLASMSHEIRTPLNSIVGYTDLLLEEERLSERQHLLVSRIQSSGSALLNIVNDILDFSEIDAGNVRLATAPTSVAAVIGETVSIIQAMAERKGLRIGIGIAPDIPPWLAGDHNRLRQILLNLSNNAVKFTESGEITVSASRVTGAEGSVTIRFAVSDTGIGIADDHRQRLFQRFSQVDGSIRRQFGGTGLGLAISRQLVELMGGEIGVDSREGVGSTFWFALPLAPCEAPVAGPPVPAATRTAGARILLVEDVEFNQDVARSVLEAAGHRVDVVDDGIDAIKAVQERRYDLVLMDVQMPGMDGITATRQIRGLGHVAPTLPIIAMTANVMPAQVAQFRAAGFNDHVAKPFRRADLLGKVVQWTEGLAGPPDVSAGDDGSPRQSGPDEVRRAS